MAFLDVTIVNIAFPTPARFPDDVAGRRSRGCSTRTHRLRRAARARRAAGRPARAPAHVPRRGCGLSSPPRPPAALAPSAPRARRRAGRAGGRRGGARADVAGPAAAGVPAASAAPRRPRSGARPARWRRPPARRWAACSSTAAGWRWVFFVNLLFGLAAIVPARRLLREMRDPAARRGSRTRSAWPCWPSASARSRWASSRRRAGAGAARASLAAFAAAARCCSLAFVRPLGAAPRDPVIELAAVPGALVRAGLRRHLRVLARLLRAAAGEHPVPDRRRGATACCAPASPSRPGR